MRSMLPAFCLLFALSTAAPLVSTGEVIGKTRGAASSTLKETGFLSFLETAFESDTGRTVDWTAVDAALAIRLGKSCEADILLVDIPGEEMDFVREGYGSARRLVMYTDFVLVGPASDPAGISGGNIIDALEKIANSETPFVSGLADSAAYQKERFMWSLAGTGVPTGKPRYLDGSNDVPDTLMEAAQRNAYTLVDRGAFLLHAQSEGRGSTLKILVEGGRSLRNQYSVILVDAKRCRFPIGGSLGTGDEKRGGERGEDVFVNWILSSRGQRCIADFTMAGIRLFTPNAGEEVCGTCW